MKTLLLLLLFMGAFLVMDGAHRESTKEAVRLAEARAAGRKRYVVADGEDLLDLQFSPRAMQHGSLFDSSDPWAFMDDVGAPAPPQRTVYDHRSRLMRGRVPAGRSAAEAELRAAAGADKPPGPGAGALAGPGKGVDGFSGAAGGIPNFLDGFAEAPRFFAEAPKRAAGAPPAFSKAPKASSKAPPAFSKAPPASSKAPKASSEAPPAFSKAPKASSKAPKAAAYRAPKAADSRAPGLSARSRGARTPGGGPRG